MTFKQRLKQPLVKSLAGLAITILSLPLLAETKAAANYQLGDKVVKQKTDKPTSTSYPLINWEDLIPKSWDPSKAFKGVDLNKLDDGDPKATALLNKMRSEWDNAPTNPTMNGKTGRIPGFVVPLEATKGAIKEFLLVPYFGACIHSPPPPANQIIHVLLAKPQKGLKVMDAVWVSGTLATIRASNESLDSNMGMSPSAYQIQAVKVEAYKGM
ncbi:DUF3299 domain-containing protein [Leeia sp. TBRC 13508]|uniref:DUF3299 domain-containing protein n=1 Tax=Leeia speluncae TaxID=2884804 RepID=A0ABS8D9P0_9NEIS|nr:DUF3299 domain-containing protein [Leeia speluncae]MCB6184929.1 DUF3299 domain-containing protein [Leeia speluncae]